MQLIADGTTDNTKAIQHFAQGITLTDKRGNTITSLNGLDLVLSDTINITMPGFEMTNCKLVIDHTGWDKDKVLFQVPTNSGFTQEQLPIIAYCNIHFRPAINL